METALVLPGGGSRTVYVSGVIIGSGLRPEQVSGVYALSSGAPVGAYFVTGQIEETGRSWIEDVATSRFLEWSRLLRLRRPGDVRALIKNGCRTLKLHAIPPAKLYVSTMRLHDGRTVYHELTPKNAREILEATCSLPVITAPRMIDGQPHVDGGVEETFPVLAAHKFGSKKILAIGNRPRTYRMEPYGRLACWLTFPQAVHARQALGRRADRLAEARGFMQNPPPDTQVLLIEPDEDLPANRLTHDTSLVRKTFDLGVAMGRKQRQRVQDFVADNG